MKILITGGAGFIGYHLAKFLIDKDFEVHIIDNFDRGKKDSDLRKISKSKNLKIFELDLISNFNKNKQKNLSKDYDYIFHLAAIVGVKNVISNPYDVLNKNILLTLAVIEIAQKQQRLKKILFASTSEVYSKTSQFMKLHYPTPENVPLFLGDLNEKRSSYFISKIYGEALFYHSNLPFIIFRPHNIYGPRMGMSHVIPELLKKFKNSKNNITVFSPNHTRSFCYIDDAIKQLNFLMKSNIKNKVFNIGNAKEEITIKKLALTIQKLLNKENLKINFKKDSHNSPVRRCPDINKILNYKNTSLNEGILQTFNWYKNII